MGIKAFFVVFLRYKHVFHFFSSMKLRPQFCKKTTPISRNLETVITITTLPIVTITNDYIVNVSTCLINLLWRGLLQTFKNLDQLLITSNIFNFLSDIQTCRSSSTNIHHNGFYKRRLGKVLNLFRHCCREKQRLSLALKNVSQNLQILYLKIRKYCTQFLFKTHIQHSISLIKNQIPAYLQIKILLIQ